MEIIDSSLFSWREKVAGRHYGRSSLSEIGLTAFPKALKVKSAWTGRVVEFTVDQEMMVENEFYDGEATAYSAENVIIVIWT